MSEWYVCPSCLCTYVIALEALLVAGNRHKSNRVGGITDEGLESRLFHPQHDRWLDHFDWSVNGTLIVGLIDVGAVFGSWLVSRD